MTSPNVPQLGDGKPTAQPQSFLPLDGGKYARFNARPLVELVLGACGRVNRGNAQLTIVGEGNICLLADNIRAVCASNQECVAEVPSLFVRYTPGDEPSEDALDIIVPAPMRRDRSFSVIGRPRILALLEFIDTQLASIAAR